MVLAKIVIVLSLIMVIMLFISVGIEYSNLPCIKTLVG